jgi:hypothetical protein
MDLNLREGYWIKFCMMLITVISLDNYHISFITLLVNWYNNRLLPVIRQFFLTSNRIECMDLRL